MQRVFSLLYDLCTYTSDGDLLISRKRILIYISGGLDSIVIFIKPVLSVLKLSKTFDFFLRTSGEYSKKYRQGSVISTDPCPYLVKYSLDVLKKKTKFLDILITDKKCLTKKYRIKSSGDMDKDPFY